MRISDKVVTTIVTGTPSMGRRGGGYQSGSTGTRRAGETRTRQAAFGNRIILMFT